MADPFELEVAAAVEAEKRRKAADDSFELEVAASVAAKKGQAKVSEPGAPATVQEQIAIGVQPYEVDTNFYAEEGELWKAAREYGVRTGEANPDGYADRVVMEKRRNVNKQDETDLTSPFFVEAATKKVKDSTEPGGLPWRAADAFGMRQYGEPTPKTSEVGWKVATTEHEREVGRALLYKNLMDGGVPESEAKVKAWAAWERGEELQVPTRENVTLSASPMVDPKVVDPKLRDDLKQAGTDMLSGLAETARDAANVAKDFSVDVYLAGGEILPRATGTMTWWADTSKRWRDAAFPSPTKAAADWLAQSDNENLRGFAERLKYAHDRDTSGAANFATGMAEMNNALNDALGRPDIAPIVGLTRVDPSQPGILNALASIPMSAPKHKVELPVPSAEEVAQHEKDAAVQYANQLQGSWSAFLQGDLEGSAAVAEAMQTGGGALSLVTTPVMDAFMIASRTPDPTERETALGWFFRTVPSASFNLGSVWIARAADYAARKSGAESWRQNRVPTGEAPTAAEALVPFWSGSYWHDWLTAVRNGDSLTPEFMRFADTMAYGMPGLSDEQRVRWMGTVGDEKAGAYRYYGTNLAMAADLLVPMDRAPHIAWGGVESAGRFHEVYGQARKQMAGTPDGAARALQTATATVAPSLTHQYLMRSDPEYRAAWDAVEQQSVRAQEDALAGQGRPLDEVVRNVTPDIDSVRLAVARAWARKAVESGYNPAAIDPRAPRVARDIANAYREYLTTLRIGKEGEDGTVAVTPDGEPPHVNEPATVQALVRLGYDPDVARTMPEADANARIAERRGPDGSESPQEPVRDDAIHAVVDEVDGLYTVAVDENIPALGKWSDITLSETDPVKWSDITLSEADPVKRLALMRAEVERHIGAPFDTITGQLPLQSALSFVDPKTGQYVRAPRLTPDALTQYAPADIEFALNRLLNATPEQVWRNAGTFERGGVAKWVDEGPVTRERVSLALKEAIRSKAIDATEQDVAAFMAVQDRVAQRLTDLGVVKSPSEWWAQAEHHLGSIREQGARGAIEFGKTGAAIITLAKTANLSTLFHENAHALRRILPAEHMKALDGFVAETYGGWGVRAEEWFARQFESVLRTGDIIPKSAPPTWTERLTAALRYAADVLRSIYRDGELPEVHPIFRQWMDEFIVGGGKVAPVDGGGLAVPKPEPVVKTVKPTRKKETVRARPGEPTMPAAARDGWSPKMLEDFARKADEVRAIKDAAAQNKAVQAWLSAIHAVIGEDMAIRSKRHRLAGGIGTKILDMMLNAGRQIVDGMTPETRATADAAYTGKAAPVSKSETTAPAPAPAPVTTPKPKSPGRALAEGVDARRKALESVSSAVRQLHAAADAGDVKATVAAIKGVTDAVTAAKATVTPEAKKAFIGAVKAATKGADVSVAVRAATEAYLNAAGMGMHEYPAPSARPNPAVPPQLPDVLLPTPAPTPIPLPPEAAAVVYARPLPSGGTDTINQYGLKRVVVGKGGNVDVTVAVVDINFIITPDVDVAFTATFDPLLGSSVLGLDVNTGSPVLAMVDSTYTPVTGAKRLAAMKELHRRGLAGEEPYATRLAALQNHMSSAAMAMGIQQPKPGEVLVRVVGSNPKVTKSVSGVANKGVVSIRVDAPAWATLPPEVTHAAWASTADVVRQVAELPYSVDMPDALARVVADGIALYTESVRSGQSIRAAAERMVDHYVAAKNAKALAVSDASVAVADAVANGRLVEHVKSMDVESVAVEHEMAVDHARRLEMVGIEHNVKNTVMPTEPPGYGPVKKLLQSSQTDTPQFKAWFGKSKVVDENGKPLVVYHGSPERGFTMFDFQKTNANDPDIPASGFHFSSSFENARRSGDHPYGRPDVQGGGETRPFFLAITNPASRKVVREVAGAMPSNWEDAYPGARSYQDAVTMELMARGYDGIVMSEYALPDVDAFNANGRARYKGYELVKDDEFGGVDIYRNGQHITGYANLDDATNALKNGHYVAFRPEQIKSAIGNRGTFDPTNPNILYQHTEHISPMAPRDPLTGDTLPVPQGDVGVIPGKDAPSRFSAEVEGQDSVISPAGQKLARGRAIPLLSREEINLALGYRADQSVYPARELAERVLAQALVSRLQASESRMAYEPISNRISVPKQRAAAVKARAMVILGDTPEIIVKAGERRPADVGVIADESPSLNLTPQEAGKVLLVLDYLRHTGWAESLPKSVRAMDINDLQTRFTTTDYRAIVNAVHDSVSGAAPYRADISRYSLARNIVWKLAQRPDGVFTPQPLETTAGWGAKVVNQARSIIGATILTGANFFLPSDTIPSMRPDIRPAWERARRELLSSAAELVEAITLALETVGATRKGATVDALVRVSAASKGWRTLVDVMPRDNGPSDLTRLRRWLYNGDPEHARQNALGTYDYVPHDLPRTAEDKSRGIVARPITDAPAEVYAHADVVERVIMAHPRSVDALSMRLIDQIRNKTLTPEDAVAVIGKMHVILNECAQTGVNALTAAAGHSGMKDHVKKVLEGTASKRGLALDAYEALFTYRWSDEPVQGVQPVPPAGKPATPAVFASIESMVRMLALSIGKENVRLRTDLWVFDVINRLNAEEIKNRLIDELVDLDYAHDLSTMADAAGHTFGSLAEEVRFAEEVKRAVNYEMWGTNYTRETRVMQGEDGNPVVVTTGRGNVEVNVKEEHISPEAMAAARVIIAKTGIRPDVLTTRKGYKGELSSAPVGSRLVSLMNDPTRMLERANDPTTWRSEGSLFTSRGRDVYLPDTVLKSLDEAIEMAAPLTERLAATLSERQLPVGVFRRVEDAFRQLKGSLITGGRSGYLTTAAFAVPILGGAHVLDAATLALGVHALSYLPRSMGYVTNAMGAYMQGVMEHGVLRSAGAVVRQGRMAYRAMQDTIRFRKMGTFVDGARAATLAVMEKATGAGRGAESVMFTTQNGHVYSLADVVRIGRDYGLDGTQARVESAAKTQVALDALYKKYDREPGVVGKLWSEITSFYERDALTENYRRMYEAVDTFFRYVWLLDGLDKGLPVHEAVSRSLRISFDYTAVAPVDRLVNFVYMFWMYQRRAIDLTVAAMIENPTGVNGLIRFMRAQDLTNGYSDLDEDYVRQSETVPDYAMARPAIDVWKVAGSKSSHMKQLFSEPPVAAATKMISDMATVDLIGLGSRAQPQYLYIINLLNGMVGGDYIDFFRKEAKEGESSAAPVSPVFVRMDQALTGGKFQNVLGYHMRYEGDPMRQPAPGAPYTFEVPGNKRVVWDAMNMIPGFANLLGNMDIHDRSDTYVDSVLEEYLRLLGSPMEVPPDSVVYPAPNQTPRPNVGLDNERDRFLGFTPAVIATPYAARARAPAMTKEALAEELRKKLAEIRRMKEVEVDQGDVMGPSELTPDRNIGIDPNKPIGVEK